MEFRLKSVEPKNYLKLERLTGHPNCSFRVIRSAQNQGLNNSFTPCYSLCHDKELYQNIQNYLMQEKKGNVEEIENFYKLIGD